MPKNVVKTPADSKKWKKAKEAAAESGHSEQWPLVMHIFQRMKGVVKSDDSNIKIERALESQGKKTALPSEIHQELHSWWQANKEKVLTPKQKKTLAEIQSVKQRRSGMKLVKIFANMIEEAGEYLNKAKDEEKEAWTVELPDWQPHDLSKESRAKVDALMKEGLSEREAYHLAGVQQISQQTRKAAKNKDEHALAQQVQSGFNPSTFSEEFIKRAKPVAQKYMAQFDAHRENTANPALNPLLATRAARKKAFSSFSLHEAMKEFRDSDKFKGVPAEDQGLTMALFEREWHKANPGVHAKELAEASSSHSLAATGHRIARTKEVVSKRDAILGDRSEKSKTQEAPASSEHEAFANILRDVLESARGEDPEAHAKVSEALDNISDEASEYGAHLIKGGTDETAAKALKLSPEQIAQFKTHILKTFKDSGIDHTFFAGSSAPSEDEAPKHHEAAASFQPDLTHEERAVLSYAMGQAMPRHDKALGVLSKKSVTSKYDPQKHGSINLQSLVGPAAMRTIRDHNPQRGNIDALLFSNIRNSMRYRLDQEYQKDTHAYDEAHAKAEAKANKDVSPLQVLQEGGSSSARSAALSAVGASKDAAGDTVGSDIESTPVDAARNRMRSILPDVKARRDKSLETIKRLEARQKGLSAASTPKEAPSVKAVDHSKVVQNLPSAAQQPAAPAAPEKPKPAEPSFDDSSFEEYKKSLDQEGETLIKNYEDFSPDFYKEYEQPAEDNSQPERAKRPYFKPEQEERLKRILAARAFRGKQ
jgi:hypothetical protein